MYDINQNIFFNLFSKIIKALKDLLGHLSYSGEHWLASVVVHCAVSVMLCPLASSQKLLGQSLLNFICRVFNVRRQEIIDFMTPLTGVLLLHVAIKVL